MDRSEFVRINIEDITQEFIQDYNLLPMVHNGWIYFEMVRGWYRLPQLGMLANNLLHTRLNKKYTSKQQPPRDCGSTSGNPSNSV